MRFVLGLVFVPVLLSAQVRQPLDSSATTAQIEKSAAAFEHNPPPTYPKKLKNAGVEGKVVAQFVVDTTGRVDTTTFKVVVSSHPLFTKAVRDLLPALVFSPAMIGDRKVREMVTHPFVFALDRK